MSAEPAEAAKKVLIVDDERLAREKIRRYLAEAEALGPFVVQEAKNGIEALEAIADFKPEVVFLDVEMPGLSGFDVLRQLPTVDFQVIFETAYDEFALRAFEENACDYLLKPFTSERLHKALARALSRAAPRNAHVNAAKVGGGYLDCITVRQGRHLIVLPVSDIECFSSQDHYTCVFAADGRGGLTEYLIELSLAHLEAHLDPALFQRAHRSALVRVGAIRSIATGPNMTVHLSGGMELAVSRAHRQAIREGALQIR